MVGLHKDPTGETIFERTNNNFSTSAKTSATTLSDTEGLRKRIKELEEEVKEKDVRMSD